MTRATKVWPVLLDRKWNLKQSNWPISVHVDISRRDTITLKHPLVPMNTVSMIDNDEQSRN